MYGPEGTQVLANRLAGLAEQHFAGQAKPDADAQEMLARIERLEGMIEGHIRQPNAHHGRLEELDKPQEVMEIIKSTDDH